MPDHKLADFGFEGRQALATKVMENGVEVIVAGKLKTNIKTEIKLKKINNKTNEQEFKKQNTLDQVKSRKRNY